MFSKRKQVCTYVLWFSWSNEWIYIYFKKFSLVGPNDVKKQYSQKSSTIVFQECFLVRNLGHGRTKRPTQSTKTERSDKLNWLHYIPTNFNIKGPDTINTYFNDKNHPILDHNFNSFYSKPLQSHLYILSTSNIRFLSLTTNIVY